MIFHNARLHFANNLVLILLISYSQLLLAAPVITGTSSFRGQPGDVITINGSGFSNDPAQNIVRFGPNRAPVREATTTSLTVQVPNAQPAAFTQITVSDSNGATSNPRFFIVFLSSKVVVAVCPWCCTCTDMQESNTSARPSDSLHRGGLGMLFTALGGKFQCVTDYMNPGRPGAEPALHYRFRRNYRTQLNSDGALGQNWRHNYFEKLALKDDGSVVHDNGLGREDHYRKNNIGEFVSPPELFTQLTQLPDNSFELLYRGGTLKRFDSGGKLLQYSDRKQNRMTFHYNGQNQLERVNDTLGRDIIYSYLVNGRLQKITDYIGREVKFTYDSKGDLTEVTTPTVIGTPNGNDFPQGKTTRYTYSSGFSDERLNHNLLTITQPNEVAAGGPPAMINTYGTTPGSFEFDKLIKQSYGGKNATDVPAGGALTYTYTPLNAGVKSDNPNLPMIRIRETDRNGNVEEFEYNRLLYPVLRREFTKGLRTGEPTFFETRMVYNADVMLIEKRLPEGNRVEYIYDEANPNRLAQGNLLTANRFPDAIRLGDQNFLKTTYTYEPRFNQVKTVTEPRGNDPGFIPPNGGAATAARYTTTHTFDYELPGDPLNPNNLEFGNIIRIQQPTVTLIEGTLQPIITEFTYNGFGQKTSEIDPEGNVDEFFFFPENDPDGDGDTTPGTRPGLDTADGGYLKERIVDNKTSSRRTEPTPPTQISNRFHYDPVGNIIQSFDGRNIRTDFFVNELNQVVQTKRAADITETTSANPPEPLPLTNFAYIQNTFFDFNDNVIQRQTEDRGNTSNTGGFVDFTFEFDILDNVVLEKQEVDTNTLLTTRFRYDANENRVMTILPEQNADSAIFDERDLLFQNARGASQQPDDGLFKPSDPKVFNRPGGSGTETSTTVYSYDSNRNLIETVDAKDNGGTKSAFKPFQPALPEMGDATTIGFDGFDRRDKVIDPLGNRMAYTYDPASNIIREISDGDAIDDVAGDGDNKTLAATEYIHDELSRVFVSHRVLFKTPDVSPLRNNILILTDTPAMDTIAAYQSDASTDTANVPESTGIAVIGRISTLTGYDRLSRAISTVQDDLDAYVTEYDGTDRVVKTIDSALDNGFSGGPFAIGSVAGNRVQTAYDDNNNPIERLETDVTKLAGVQNETFCTTYFYDALDRLATVTDNIGQTEDYRYDSRDNLAVKADAVGKVNSRSIHRRGLCGSAAVAVNSFGNVTRTFYDGINRTVQTEAFLTVDGEGDDNETYIGANIFGVKINPPDNYLDTGQSEDGRIVVDYAYDDNSQLLALRDDDGNTTGYLYDNQNRTIIERKGMTAGFQGAVFLITDGDSGTFQDVRLPPVLLDPPEETEPGGIDNGTDIEHFFDRDNNVVTIIDEATNEFNCTFDALNRKKSCAIDRAPGFIGTTLQTFKFDGLSRLTQCLDNNEPDALDDDITTAYFYDSLSRKVEETQKIGDLPARAISNNFDIATAKAVGQPSALIYPDGRQVNNRFDNLDRLEARRDDGQNSDIGQFDYIGKFRVAALTYQNNTRLTHLGGAGGKTDTGFDDLRRIVNHRWEAFTTEKRGNGQLIVGFEHQDGNLTSTPLYDRANNKRIEFKTHDSDNSEQYKYDSLYRLTSTGGGDQGANSRGFERGTFVDDDRKDMTVVNFSQDWDLDGLGNWTRLDDDGREETRKHSDFNEIFDRFSGGLIGGTSPLLHDKNGNTLNTGYKTLDAGVFPGGGLRIEFDALNRIRKVYDNENSPDDVSDDRLVAEYSYDCQNRRLRKVVSNGGINEDIADGVTDFYYDGWRNIEERATDLVQDTDAVLQQYTFGNYLDEVLTLDDRRNGVSVAELNDGAGAERHFYHVNTLYHVYVLTAEGGSTVPGEITEAVREYDAYGKVSGLLVGPGGDGDWFTGDDVLAGNPNISGVGNPWFYTGQRLDGETGVMYYKNRYYSTELGRFLQRDPIGYDASSLGLYEYVSSRVTALMDAYGLGNYAFAQCNEDTGVVEPHYLDAYKKLKCNPVKDCIKMHEQVHVRQLKPCCGKFRDRIAECRTLPLSSKVECLKKARMLWKRWVGGPKQPKSNYDAHECEAHKVSLECLIKARSKECCFYEFIKEWKLEYVIRNQHGVVVARIHTPVASETQIEEARNCCEEAKTVENEGKALKGYHCGRSKAYYPCPNFKTGSFPKPQLAPPEMRR